VPNDEYFVPVGLQRTNTKIVNMVTGVLISPQPDPGRKPATGIKTYTTLHQDLHNTIPRLTQHYTKTYTTLYQDLHNTTPRLTQHYTKTYTTLHQDIRRTNNSNIFLLFVRRKSWYSVV
jgi:hypothetical protein